MHSAAVSRMAAVCARHNRTERLACAACNRPQGPTPCRSAREPHIPCKPRMWERSVQPTAPRVHARVRSGVPISISKPRMHQACSHNSHRITLAGGPRAPHGCTAPTARNIQPSQPEAGTPRPRKLCWCKDAARSTAASAGAAAPAAAAPATAAAPAGTAHRSQRQRSTQCAQGPLGAASLHRVGWQRIGRGPLSPRRSSLQRKNF
jgi:hypothetical protein